MLYSASFALSRNPWKHLAAEPKNTQSPITQERPTTGKRPPPVCLSRSAVRPIRAKHGRDNKHRSDFPNESRKIFKCAESPLPLTAYPHSHLAIVSAIIFSAMPKPHPLTEQCTGVYQAARRLFDKHKPFRLRMAALSGIAPRKWKISSQECRCTILR